MKIEELQGMYKRIYDICQKHTECKDNDRYLIWMIWSEDLGVEDLDCIYLCDFLDKNISSPETIRRSRQKLQQHGICVGTRQVQKGRQKRAVDLREPIAKDRPEPGQTRLF